MAQVPAGIRNTGIATELINRHVEALDEGIAARRAVQKEADGAVKGGPLGGVVRHLRRLVEADDGATAHLGLDRVELDGYARVAGDHVGFDGDIKVLQPADDGTGNRVGVGANDDAAGGGRHGGGLAVLVEFFDVDADDADAFFLQGGDGLAQGVPSAGIVAGLVADQNYDPATIVAVGDGTGGELIERVDPVLGVVSAAPCR